MFCGIGRNKDKDCKKPPVSPVVFGKNPSTSPITVKEEKPTEVKLSAISPVTVGRQTSDEIYKEAVKLLDVENETEKRTEKLGLVTPGKLPGRARGLTAYKTTKSKTKKKGGKRKTRRTRKRKGGVETVKGYHCNPKGKFGHVVIEPFTHTLTDAGDLLQQTKGKRVLVNLEKKCVTEEKEGGRKSRRRRKSRKKRKRKTRKKRKRKTKRRKKKRKTRKRRRKGGDTYYNVDTQTWDDLRKDINSSREGFIVRYWTDLKDLSLDTKSGECEDYSKIDRKYKVNISVDIDIPGNMLFSKPEIINMDPSRVMPPAKCYWSSTHSTQSLSREEFEFATKTGVHKDIKQHQWISIRKK